MAKKINVEIAPLFAGLDLNDIHSVETVSEDQAEKYQFDTVDFSDPNRPKTCLEVDFPILKVNEIASLEVDPACKKAIYKMSKWWARRSSGVFRSLCISAALKSPNDELLTSQLVWSQFYRKNLQKKKFFSHLKIVDIFMGGGTTVVEAARLGFDVTGIDINPIAWWVVNNQITISSKVKLNEFLDYLEKQVNPQIAPFYATRHASGKQGHWVNLSGRIEDVNMFSVVPENRKQFRWVGAEILHTFWMKHSMCSDPDCNHLTPIVNSSIVAEKLVSIKYYENCVCPHCGDVFDLELDKFRMAPTSKYEVYENTLIATLNEGMSNCPSCKKNLNEEWLSSQNKAKGKPLSKKVQHYLVLPMKWLKGLDSKEKEYFGGYPGAQLEQDARWLRERSNNLALIEIRGTLPEKFMFTSEGNKQGSFVCGKCGRVSEISSSSKIEGHLARFFPYMVQCYDPNLAKAKDMYRGKFFDIPNPEQYIECIKELKSRTDLIDYIPKDELWFGHQTHQRDNLPGHGYKKWTDMFTPRQIYSNSLLLKEIMSARSDEFSDLDKSHILGAFQNFLRQNCMLTIWSMKGDQLKGHFSNNNYHPKNTPVENSLFPKMGSGNFISCVKLVLEGAEYTKSPHERRVSYPNEKGKSQKVITSDWIDTSRVKLICGSSTDLRKDILDSSVDMVITDPPFGDNVQYAELADFFLVWLASPLSKIFPDVFSSRQSPKTLEAVSNKARQPGNTDDGARKADEMYDRLLTKCWSEAYRILKPGGLMAFTFHHDKDDAWINVLESLFKAGFRIESAFPIRSDVTKGNGDFGSKKIEYDIVHVCRKRTSPPTEIFWATLRKKIIESVKSRSTILAQHKQSGLHLADLEVIIRGEVLEQYSTYYGKIKKNIDGDLVTVREILIEANNIAQSLLQSTENEKVPDLVDPETKIYFSLFRDAPSIEFNAARKRLKGTGTSLEELESYGWVSTCKLDKEKVSLTTNIVERWNSLSRKKTLSSDLDQAHFAINCCIGGKQLDGKPADLESWIENHYKSLLPSVVPLLKYMEGNHFGADYRQAIGMAYRTIERTLNRIKETDGEFKKASDQLSLFE